VRTDVPRDDALLQDPLNGPRSWANAATIGIFVLLMAATLYFCQPLLMPVMAALIVGMTLAPIVRSAAKHGIPTSLTSIALVLAILGVGAFAITVLAAPIGEWIGRGPEIAARMREKLFVLDRPLEALQALQESVMPKSKDAVKVDTSESNILLPIVTYLTPAVGQIIIFLGTLTFYLLAQHDLRKNLVGFFVGRKARLRVLRIANSVEHDLASYVGLVTAINFSLGIIVALGAWLFGFPNPWIFGIVAMTLNYLPYIGSAVTAIVLFGVGLVTFPSLVHAILPTLAFVALTMLEGHFITPAILGRRLTLPPLFIFLSLVFWTWMWGPIGTFLAVPFSIIAIAIYNHLRPENGNKFPA
jgi:predicted PurR-regulated permease PerM